jgi:hypothetical protein
MVLPAGSLRRRRSIQRSKERRIQEAEEVTTTIRRRSSEVRGLGPGDLASVSSIGNGRQATARCRGFGTAGRSDSRQGIGLTARYFMECHFGSAAGFGPLLQLHEGWGSGQSIGRRIPVNSCKICIGYRWVVHELHMPGRNSPRPARARLGRGGGEGTLGTPVEGNLIDHDFQALRLADFVFALSYHTVAHATSKKSKRVETGSYSLLWESGTDACGHSEAPGELADFQRISG